MTRNRTLALSLALAALLVGSLALAFGPRTGQRAPAGQAFTGAQRGPVADIAGASHGDLAALLAISEETLAAERASGKTVADILVEHGLTTAEASAKLAAQRDARIAAAVAAGSLDPQRAAAMKSRTAATIAAMLTRELGPRAGSMWGPATSSPMATQAGNRAARGPGVMAQAGVRSGRAGAAQPGVRGGPGQGIHEPGYRFTLPGN